MLLAALADPRKAAGLAGSARADAAMLRKLGFGLTAGRNRLQGPLVPGKQRAWTRPVPVEAVKAAGAATGSTVNDLMLTAITSALRRYLLEHDALAEEVIVIVPVNLRPAGASLPAGLGNEFGLASDAHLLPGHDRLLALLDEEVGALHTPTVSSSPPEPGS